MSKPVLSETALTNLFTMGIAAQRDPRQEVPADYYIPREEIRRLRAHLILEEAMETIHALGFEVSPDYEGNINLADPRCLAAIRPVASLEDIIDGACDTIFVCVGLLCSCGAPDLPHLAEVNRANSDKFPDGKAIIDEHGKYQKPPGWKPPDHAKIIRDVQICQTVSKLLTESGPARRFRTVDGYLLHKVGAVWVDSLVPEAVDHTFLAAAIDAWPLTDTGERLEGSMLS